MPVQFGSLSSEPQPSVGHAVAQFDVPTCERCSGLRMGFVSTVTGYFPEWHAEGVRVIRPAEERVDVSPGEPVRINREPQGLSQTQLSQLCGIPQATISSIENH